jgi:hypothetical protein
MATFWAEATEAVVISTAAVRAVRENFMVFLGMKKGWSRRRGAGFQRTGIRT